MTRGAWIMLVPVWSVILFFSIYFLWRVLALPAGNDQADQSSVQE